MQNQLNKENQWLASKQYKLKLLFNGNKLLTDQELQSVVAKWKDKTLTFDELQSVITDIQEYYSSKNRIGKALLPEQEIKMVS